MPGCPMARFPCLPLWTDAWIADTYHLNRCERGTYIDLLILMWRTPGCRVPRDKAWLAKHMRMTIEEVGAELWPIVQEFCQSDGNWIFQGRLQREFAAANDRKQKAIVSAKYRWNKEKDTCDGNARLALLPSPSPSPTLLMDRLPKTHECALNGAFVSFWKVYPRKKGKIAAEKALAKALKTTTLEIILNAIKHAQWSNEPQYIPYPATWLNKGCWDDQRDKTQQEQQHEQELEQYAKWQEEQRAKATAQAR